MPRSSAEKKILFRSNGNSHLFLITFKNMFMKPLNNTFMLKFHDETNKNFKLL